MNFQEIIKQIKCSELVDNIAIVGSYVKNIDAVNIDVLLLHNNKISNIVKLLNNIFEIKGKKNEDVIQYFYEKKCYSFLIEKQDCFIKRVKDITNGKNYVPRNCNWTIAGWLPESFLLDLSTMDIVYEKENFLTNLKKELAVYPPKLKKAIIKFSKQKLENIKLIKCSSENIYINQICDVEKMIYEIRKQYAENEVYLHSIKSVLKEKKYEEQ